jgi:hypothetical protein
LSPRRGGWNVCDPAFVRTSGAPESVIAQVRSAVWSLYPHLAIAALASFVPPRRAVKVDPMVTLPR